MVRYTVGLSGDVANILDDKYEELCESANVYEVTSMDTPMKLFCDIDIYDEKELYHDAIAGVDIITEMAIDKVKELLALFGIDAKWCICDSSSPSFTCWKTKKQKWKVSRHIIFHNVLATKRQQGIIFKYLNEEIFGDSPVWKDYFPKDSKQFFDVSVYYIEKFRAVHASKPDENRPLTIVQGTFQNTVLSAFFEDCQTIDENHEFFLKMKSALDIKSVPISTDKGDDDINKFLVTQYIERGLLDKYANNYGDWFRIFGTICCMFEEETAWRLGDAFSRRSASYDECGNQKIFQRLLGNDKEYGIQHIRTDAQKADKKVYAEIEVEKKQFIAKKKEEQKRLKLEQIKQKHLEKQKEKDEKLRLELEEVMSNVTVTTCETDSEMDSLIDVMLKTTNATDYDLAKAFCKFVDVYYSFHAKCWYIFDKKWRSDLSGSIVSNILSEDFHQLFANRLLELFEEIEESNENQEQHEKLRKKIQKMSKTCEKIKKTTDKSHIITEVKAIALDESIRKMMNRQQYLLPLKGGVSSPHDGRILDLKTLEIIEMTKDHLFDYECGADYIDLNQEQEEYVRKYFMQLFCDNEQTMQCFLDIIKTNFAGLVTRYIYFWVGTGRNGKSLLLKIIQKILDRGMDIISKDVVLTKKSNSHLSTEFEKLDKIRIGFITELNDTDVLNIDNIKAITGGDLIDVRGICKTNESIRPTINIHSATNELPTFKGQEAIGDRLVIIPFNNKFEVDINFEDEIMSHLDWIFSFIVKHGKIMDKFELSEEMQVAKKDYQDDNNTDNLREFIESKCEEGQTQTGEFMIAYQDWLKKMKRWEKTMTTNTFSRRMKKLGYENVATNGKRYFRLNII
jgi:P4 family phage/plasmid primase-like protien